MNNRRKERIVNTEDNSYGSGDGKIGGTTHAEDFKKAVALVRGELSEENVNIFRYSLEQAQSEERPFPQKDFGIAIRNLLARNGIVWEEVVLFSVWFAILRQALETFLDS